MPRSFRPPDNLSDSARFVLAQDVMASLFRNDLFGLRRHPDRLIRRRNLRNSLLRLLGFLVAFAGLHTVAMIVFEGLGPFEGLWLTLTTLTTVGYGDYAAETIPGRLSTMLLVFLGGIWVAFQSAETYFEFRWDRRERKRRGRWRWNLQDHILLLNVPDEHPTEYLRRLVGEFRANRRFSEKPLQLVSDCFENGLPEALSTQGVVHYLGCAWDPAALSAAGARAADLIVVLAESDSDPGTDGRTLDIVDRLRELGARGRILAECVDDRNRRRFERFGADLVVRPMRGYPEIIVRALAAPGSEVILENLFTSRGDECWRYDVSVTGWAWRDIVSTLVAKDIGIPIAYRYRDGAEVVVNPPPDSPVTADKVYVLVREGNARSDGEVAALLNGAPGDRR